eukprot:653076-Rhodomonas_salina.3
MQRRLTCVLGYECALGERGRAGKKEVGGKSGPGRQTWRVRSGALGPWSQSARAPIASRSRTAPAAASAPTHPKITQHPGSKDIYVEIMQHTPRVAVAVCSRC